GSARAETSHTVTGRPPRARLACRSTSRLPSAYVSGRVTAAPWRTLPPGGRPKGAAPDGASVESGGRVLHMRRPRRPVKQRSGRPGVYCVSPLPEPEVRHGPLPSVPRAGTRDITDRHRLRGGRGLRPRAGTAPERRGR